MLIMIFALFLFIAPATANLNVCELVQINSTHWYFKSAQTGLSDGIYSYQAFANNISSDYRVVTVDTIPPASITGLTNSTGDFWHNWTWTNPIDADFNYTSVYINSMWVVNTSNEYYNLSADAHNSSTISTKTVDTTGNVNATWVNHTSVIPNNAVTITNTGDWTDNEKQTVNVDYDRTDADDDAPSFSCNRTDLFADFNTATGVGSWVTGSIDSGIYLVDFGVSDGYGSTDNYTMTITVIDLEFIPPNPTNLSNTTGNFWIRHAWNAGAGNITDGYNVTVNGSWYNTTDSFINLNKPPHGYQNITVQAWNSSGVGTLSAGTLSDNVSLPNNPITLTNYSLLYSVQEFDTITIDFDYTDVDGDVVTFATNAVNGSLDSATGVYSWTTTLGDRCDNYWTFNVSDGYGSVDSITINVIVTYPVSSAFMETFGYHPYANVEWSWDNDADNLGSVPWYVSYTADHAGSGGAVYIEKYNGHNVSKLYAWGYDYFTGGDTGTVTCMNYAQLDTQYFSFNLIDGLGSGYTSSNAFLIDFYDVHGVGPATYTVRSSVGVGQPGYKMVSSTKGLYEFQVMGTQIYLIHNGTDQGPILAWNAENIGYVGIRASATGCSYGTSHLRIWLDDISTSGDVVGINADRSPDSYNTHYFTRTELDFDDQPDYEVNVSYTFNTLTTNPTAAQYQMKIQKVLDSSITNTTTIKDAGTAWSNDMLPFGTIEYNRTDIFGDNYGLYLAYTTKDGTILATDYIYWMNMNIPGNSYVVVDLPTYPAGAQISPSYFIDNINLLEYKYYIKTLSLFGTQMDISSDLVVDTGTVEVDTTGYDVTSYWCILVRESRADCSAVEMASDLFAITNTISAEGIVYDAESGSPLGDSKVALYQNSLWYNTTTNSTTGEYNLSDLTTDIDITVYAEHTGYTHESFTFTPLVAGIISLDIYMIPDTPSYTGTAIGGLALYAPYHQALNGATVNLWNSSWSDDTASSATGYYLFDNIVNGSFTGNATMPGYSATTNEDIVTASGDYTQQNYLLQPLNTLTVKAKDASTHATIMTYSVVFDGGVTYVTTDGFVNITTGIGIYKVEVSVDGYYVGIDYATVVSDTEITLYLVPVDDSGDGIYYPSHYVSFIVQSITGTPYANVIASVYNAASSSGTAIYSDVTGSDGVVGFELNETTLYRITFVDVAQGIDEEFTLYPIDTEYVVIVSSSISFITETPDTNLTNTTVEYTNQSWSIQNLTGDYLSTTLGISHTGQGVIAATICWATCTVACGVPTIAVLAILAQLGVVSWIMVLFTGMTMLSIYILGGKIG